MIKERDSHVESLIFIMHLNVQKIITGLFILMSNTESQQEKNVFDFDLNILYNIIKMLKKDYLWKEKAEC